MFKRADRADRHEGEIAYARYHQTMRGLADHYDFPIERVIAAFVSLSPNTDYTGNLRSTASVLSGIRQGLRPDQITVSGYNHCRDRAYRYAIGAEEFVCRTRGPKVLNFYYNVLSPGDNRYVTVDGHVSAAWRGANLTMREAIVRRREYREIADSIKQLAFREFLLPNQYQAILWFARKRTLLVKYTAQLGLWQPPDDLWNTYRDVQDIKPYPVKP